MGMPNDLVLVRHGESEGNKAVTASKQGDNSYYTQKFKDRHNSTWRLTDFGREQAKKAGSWIKHNISSSFDRYYTSEYLRAVETAAYLDLQDAMWMREFYLRERDWGEMDCISREERRQKYGESLERRKKESFVWWPPAGESIAQICLRVDRKLDTLHRECDGKRVIIVCHGEVMWAFRVLIERMTLDRFRELDESSNPFDTIHNCQIIHYTRNNPLTGNCEQYINWMRTVVPWDISLSSNTWQKIERERYSNKDLLAYAAKTKRQIH
jgi:broad specificity phosphatase PhoE